MLVCNITLVTVLTCVYVRRKKRNKKIDWYLRVLKESETSYDDETIDYVNATSKPYSNYNLVSNNYTDSSVRTEIETNT